MKPPLPNAELGRRPVTPERLEQGLEHLRKAALDEPTVHLDVAGIQARIASEVARGDVSSAFISMPKRRWQPWAAVGLAATVSLLIATHHVVPTNHEPAYSNLPARGELGREQGADGLDGSKLQVQQVVLATNHDVTIRHAERATWRLMAGGRARVIENGPERITLSLEAGLIQADVVPKPKHESFAIEVEQTRVAVHGTVFSVERQGDIAEVVVREGKVVVGDAGRRGDTQGTLLTAPSRASLEIAQNPALDGGSDETSTTKPPDHHSNSVVATPTPALPSSTLQKTQERPEPQELDNAWTALAAKVSTCFAEHTAGSPSVRVSFKTSLSLTISSLGTVVDVDFAPPIPSAVRDCALQQVSHVTTRPSLQGAVVSRPMLLTR